MANLSNFFFFLILIIILSISSCQESPIIPTSYEALNLRFKFGEKRVLPLDSMTAPASNYFQLLKDDTLKYCFYNTFNKSIYIYDFEHSNLLKQIKLKNESGIIPNLDAFYIINKDSIFLLPEYDASYYFCDYDGNIYDKNQFVDKDDQNKVLSQWVSSAAPIVSLGSSLYINNVFGWIAKPEENDKFLLIKYDYKTAASDFLVKHPTFIYNKNYENTTFRHMKYVKKEGPKASILYSFNCSPYVYDLIEQDSFFCAPPEFQMHPGLRKKISSEKAWLAFQSNYTFSKMIYDANRKILARFVLLPYPIDDLKSGIINSELPKKPRLLLFDETRGYELMGQIELDEEKEYNIGSSFATKEGIWIQELSANEDFIYFQLITY